MFVTTWAFCPSIGCGWRWAVSVDQETGKLAEGEIARCMMCSTEENAVLGIIIPPETKDHIEAVQATGQPTAEEAAIATDLMMMIGQRSPNLKMRRFLFAGQPAAVLYEHVNPEGTYGRIRPMAVLLSPSLLKALRPPKDWALKPATLSLTEQTEKGEDCDDTDETSPDETV